MVYVYIYIYIYMYRNDGWSVSVLHIENKSYFGRSEIEGSVDA